MADLWLLGGGNKSEIEQEKLEQKQLRIEKDKYKSKGFKSLSTRDKDELLEQIAKDLGYL